MAGFRRPEVPRAQMVLWSHRLDDAIPPDHPVRQFEYLLRADAFSETFAAWEREYVLAEGKPPYHPRDLSGVYLYGMMNRIRSSRQLEASCYNRLDVIWLMQGQCPDHSTISGFVKDHGPRLRRLFRDVVQVALRAGLVKLDHVAIDGTKVEADAGKGSVRSEKSISASLQRVEEQLSGLEQEWAANEARESHLFGEHVPWAPAGSRSDRERLAELKRQQARLEEALAGIERRRHENPSGKPPKPIASTTDPESRVMPDKEGKSKPNYNPQVGVDASKGVIVSADVTDAADDAGQLTPELAQVASNCDRLPAEASADSNYNTGPELEQLERWGVTGLLPDSGQRSEVPDPESPSARAVSAAQSGETLSDEQWSALPKDREGRITKAAFRYDAEADVYHCPMGHTLTFLRNSQDRKKWGTAIRAQYGSCCACATCPRASMCCRDPGRGRTISRDQYEPCRERLRARMAGEVGRRHYRLRRQTVEPRIGLIKHGLGLRRFLRRGLAAAKTEWMLACTAVNVGILLRNWDVVQAVL